MLLKLNRHGFYESIYLVTKLVFQLCDCIPEVVQPHPPVRRFFGPAIRTLALLHHRAPWWLQLLGQSVLLLGIFHRFQHFMGDHSNAHCHKELEEDFGSISSREGEDPIILHSCVAVSCRAFATAWKFIWRYCTMHAVQEWANHDHLFLKLGFLCSLVKVNLYLCELYCFAPFLCSQSYAMVLFLFEQIGMCSAVSQWSYFEPGVFRSNSWIVTVPTHIVAFDLKLPLLLCHIFLFIYMPCHYNGNGKHNHNMIFF